MKTRIFVLAVCLGFLSQLPLRAASGISGPLQLTLHSNDLKSVTWPRALIPALETNALSVGTTVDNFSDVNPAGIVITTNGYSLQFTNSQPSLYFKLLQAQMSSNALLTANVLNRLAYGPTPDELERVAAIGPQAYIEEQLAPETILTLPDNYISVTTNGVNAALETNWTTLTVTGQVSTTTLYVYLTGAGSAFIDDLSLSLIYTNTTYVTNGAEITTNYTTYPGPNVLRNGDFEQSITNGWTRTADFANSTVVAAPVASGSGALQIIATAPGAGNNDAIIQANIPGLTNGYRCILTFSYLPRPNSGNARINIRLSGGGTLASDVNPPPQPQWYYATVTGVASGNPQFYFFLNGAGEVYIDDAKIVAGLIPGVGPNLLRNGDFEDPVLTNDWSVTADFANSTISTTRSFSGNGSLRLRATAGGSGGGDSVFQSNIAGLAAGQTYTLSFWYTLPSQSRVLTARLSGSATVGLLRTDVPFGGLPGLKGLLNSFAQPSPDTGTFTARSLGGGNLSDLRAWYILNAIGSPRQLLEVLTQFLENHFVTEHAKSYDYFDRYYNDSTVEEAIATEWEYREITGWRNALLNPNCTFYDLLKVHAESPAQIVYLDTVESRGDGTRVANENYARELFELYCMGVDNGYDQLDITAMSRAWTGWTVNQVDRENINNPFAPITQTYGLYPATSGSGISNRVGVWTFSYNTNWHGTNRAPILSTWHINASRTNLVPIGPKTYAPRLGAPWAGRPYQIRLPRRTGSAGIQDGYDVIASLSTNIYTAEYLSIKLCRLFIHDEFPNPTTTVDLPEYAYYDYANPNRSAEAELIRQCIVAWDTPGPDGRKGHIRSVLRTIFDSELFRGHAGSLQKVKTPVEFAVSAIRALRSANPNGSFTANTDGYSISGRSRTSSSSPLVRMGNMKLFDRDAPDGYPEAGAPWISGGTLAERIRFIQTMLMTNNSPAKADNISGGNFNVADPVALLKKKLPSSSWNNAGLVADYFLSILFPGEGKANLDLYRGNAINFLNTSDEGTSVSLFSNLNNTTTPYDTRVRAMVAMLMTLQRFQEQ
ncbi:MAG: DUF1800 family protein [Verrucomicrobia bacterium]|nr:DUF1800 family protein [Verrucomicrobiota bacterium]